MRALVAAACLAVMLATVDSAWAQRGRGLRRMFVSKAQLAALPDVQVELKMTDKQKQQVAEINDQLGKDRHELWGTGFDRWREIRGRAEELSRKASTKVDDLLKPEQRKRLQEIAIQQNGPRALRDSDVVAELGLSEEQKAKLAAADEENTQAFEEAVQESGQDDWRQRVGELIDEADKRLLAVLDEKQQAAFKQLEGEEFDVDLSPLFRGRRGNR
jgi:hypothetical protein